MTRQSITLAKKNDEWLKSKIAEEEFTSKREAVNYLSEQERDKKAYDDYVIIKLEKGEKSGFSTKTKEELLAEIKSRLNVQV